jgi:hypothetical protein
MRKKNEFIVLKVLDVLHGELIAAPSLRSEDIRGKG